jgi:peptidoglycan glycosyltransferase
MNRNIRRLAVFFLVAFAIMIGDVTYWQVIDASSMQARPDNQRNISAALQIRRGRIYDRNGVLLAGRMILKDGTVQRFYTDPSLSTVIGYSTIRLGTSELEQSYNDYLTGQVVGTDWKTFFDHLQHRPIFGNDLTLTIDDRIQRAVDQIMPSTPSAAIISDPRTGEILAMVSHPGFDANQVNDNAYWSSLLKDPNYPPGSTFKIITMSSSLDSGVMSINNTFYGTDATGPVTIQGHTFPDTINNLNGCGGRYVVPPITYPQALMCSDNIVFAQVGVKMGTDRFTDYAHRFGIDSSPPFAIPVSRSRLLEPGERFDNVALASTAFGQGGLHVTPMQMLLATEAIADNGSIPKPLLVKKITSPDGIVIGGDSGGTLATPVSPQAAQATKSAMELVVQQGTGVLAQIYGVAIAGKTGTAETGGTTQPHAWFVAFAPADQPRVAITLIVEHGGEGSTVAAPLAKRIFEAVLPLVK